MLRANGLAHHVVEWGDPRSSEVVLLCHGFLDLAWGFADLAPALALDGRRVIALDFRGHGESDRVGAGGYYYFTDYLLDLHELVPQLVDGSFHLLGHSMGGTVSSLYAATHATQIRTLSLLEGLGPNSEPPERALPRLQHWLDSAASARTQLPAPLRDLDDAVARLRTRHHGVELPFLRKLAAHATAAHPSGTGLCWRFDPLHRTLSPIGFDRGRFMQALALITAPTLVLQGELGFRSSDDAERIAQLPRARREIVGGAGHMLHWSHCAQVTSLLREHLTSACKEGAPAA